MERRADDGPPAAESPAEDPAWRLTAWALPFGAGLAAILVAIQLVTGGLDRATGCLGILALTLLGMALARDARRRAMSGLWARGEVHEFALPLTLLLVALVLLVHGAAITSCAPVLLALVPVAWGIAHAPRVERVVELLPRALPVVNTAGSPVGEDGDGEVEAIVREVLDGLPPDITARLDGWSVEVRDDYLPRPRDQIVYGCAFGSANVIAIYRRPHLRFHGHGERLRRQVTYTVLHEIAHALGLDETGVRRLGWLSDTYRGRRVGYY